MHTREFRRRATRLCVLSVEVVVTRKGTRHATASPPNARSIGPDVTPHRITTEAPGSSARSRGFARTLPKGDERRRKDEHLERKNSFPSTRRRRRRRARRRARRPPSSRRPCHRRPRSSFSPARLCRRGRRGRRARRGAARPACAPSGRWRWRLSSFCRRRIRRRTRQPPPVSFVSTTRKNASVEGGAAFSARRSRSTRRRRFRSSRFAKKQRHRSCAD